MSYQWKNKMLVSKKIRKSLNEILQNCEDIYLTHFSPVSHFYTP